MTPSPRPVVLPTPGGDVAGWLHEAEVHTRLDVAVLLCPPWGWDDVASARVRRTWAAELAGHGLPVLRLDLPGCGDSAGSPRDPDLVGGWVGALVAAAAWLRERPGTSRVAALGLGLGGLLARAAAGRGAPLDDLVLWNAPPTGRAFTREMRAFARLTGMPFDDGAGGLVVNGFVLTGATLKALGALDAEHLSAGRLRRALVLDAPGPRGSAAAGLAEQGVAVDEEPMAGWGELTAHPEQSVLPPPVATRVREWLAVAARRAAAPIAPPPQTPALHACDGAVVETPLAIDAPGGRLAGVVARPAARAAQDRCVVFLSAGAVRRVGPDRLWVEAARRLARAGVPSLRADLASVGDSDGLRPEGPWHMHEFYEEVDGDPQVAAVLDAASAIGRDLAIVGLCSGGYWGFRGAADPRVTSALIVNAGALEWDPRARAHGELRRLSRLRDPAWWRKLASGGVDLRPSRFRRLGGAVVHGGAPADRAAATVARLDALQASGTRVVLGFSDGEPAYEDLEQDGVLDTLDRWPALRVVALPGADHTLRPLEAQAAFHRLVDRELLGAVIAA